MIPQHLGLPLDLSVSCVFPFLEEQIAAVVLHFNLCITIGAKSMIVLVLQFGGAMTKDGWCLQLQ
jgi:hydrogenase/urease accessory protein HupE